jgi:hypothetical protein
LGEDVAVLGGAGGGFPWVPLFVLFPAAAEAAAAEAAPADTRKNKTAQQMQSGGTEKALWNY